MEKYPELNRHAAPCSAWRELYVALAFVRPLACAIAEDGDGPKWRRERAKEAIAKMDAAMVAADSLPNVES